MTRILSLAPSAPLLLTSLFLSACAPVLLATPTPGVGSNGTAAASVTASGGGNCGACACPACGAPAVPLATTPPLAPANWSDLPGWSEDALAGAWDAFLQSCASGRWKNGATVAPGAAAANPPRSELAASPPRSELAANPPRPDVAASPPPAASASRSDPAASPSRLDPTAGVPRIDWAPACAAARQVAAPASTERVRAFFLQHFAPWAVSNPDGTREGTITGYYEPLLRASRQRLPGFEVPVYAVPDDLLTIELGDLFPELKNKRVRGRIEGNRVVPYHDRAGIRARADTLRDKVLAWGDDPIEVFFLQIQGSGRLRLPDGKLMRIGYADQNGHPYLSIGRLLVERGELTLDQASMQNIQAWARANPAKLDELLDANPSFVFFRELPSGDGGPIGALGVPLTERRSIAIDPTVIPLGAPVFLATTEPNTTVPLNRLMFAQDTGGAIKGAVRGDFFWGYGAEAGALAGRMRQSGRLWVLLPRTAVVPQTPPVARNDPR